MQPANAGGTGLNTATDAATGDKANGTDGWQTIAPGDGTVIY
jgi:hypothetical protein